MSNFSRGRHNPLPLNNLTCPICNSPHDTEGWLKWHIRKYHPEFKIVESAAGAREDNKYDTAAAHMGLGRCPHIGVYCAGPFGKRTEACLGKEECFQIELKPYFGGLFKEGQRLDTLA